MTRKQSVGLAAAGVFCKAESAFRGSCLLKSGVAGIRGLGTILRYFRCA